MRKVIVFGGSAGGIETLCDILGNLPADLPAALLAVIHISERSSQLPAVLGRCSPFRVASPGRAEPIVAGNLYLPQPNRHLVVKSGYVVSCMGPRENRHRPAVDALFRSAARVYRSQLVGVVISGALNDGSAGAAAIHARGGTVVVQDPDEAMVRDMPASVLREIPVNHCLPHTEIAKLLTRLVEESSTELETRRDSDCETLPADGAMAELDPPGFTCPECGGILVEVGQGENTKLRCHVGHSFSLDSFSEAHADALERALWVSLRRLNEQQAIQENLAKAHATNRDLKKRFLENAAAAEHDKELLHEILERL